MEAGNLLNYESQRDAKMTWRSGDCVAHCWCDTILQKVRQRCASDDHPFSSAISKRARRMRPALYGSL